LGTKDNWSLATAFLDDNEAYSGLNCQDLGNWAILDQPGSYKICYDLKKKNISFLGF